MRKQFAKKFRALLAACLAMTIVACLSACSSAEKSKAEHVNKGNAYLKDRRFQEASLEFRNAIQIDDRLGAAHWGLAQAYEGLQRFPEMLDELRKTIDLDAKNLDARIKLGTYYLAASKGQPTLVVEAEKLAQDVLQKDPRSIEGHILLSSIRFTQNQRDAALAELNQAIELDPNRSESYLSLARFYQVTGEPGKAEETLRHAVSISPSSPLVHTEYGKFLAQANRLPEAEVELKKAVEVAPTDHDARIMLASFYQFNKQLDKAEETYKDLAALEKNQPETQALLANFYSSVNRTDEAIKIFQGLITNSPDYVSARYRLAEILLLSGDTAGAQTQIDGVLQRDPHDRQALVLRARVRSATNDPTGLREAIADLNEVLKQEPNSQAGLYFMAQTNFNLGAIDEARVYAGDLERNYPNYLPAKLLQVQISGAAGEPQKAITLASDLIERLGNPAASESNSPQLLDEMRARTLLARGSAQLQLRNANAARLDYESARQITPNEPEIYNHLAAVSRFENKPDEALGFYQSALKLRATDFNALNGMIAVYSSRNEIDKAQQVLDAALNPYPNMASLHFLKAQVYGVQRDAQNTENELRKALELDKNYIPAYTALAALFINTGQQERALAEYKKLVELRPDYSQAYTLIGMLEDSRKNYDVAVENYRKALDKDQDAAVPANNLAWLYANYSKGNLDEAVRLAQGVVQKNPSTAGFIDTLGWVYYKKGLFTAAADQLRKAVSLDDVNARMNSGTATAVYHYHLAMALRDAGDKAASRREFENALRLSAKSPFADMEEARKTLASL